MPRAKTRNRKDEMEVGDGDTPELPDETQGEIFPELDKDKPKEMELRKALKRWSADKKEHAEAMDTLKQAMDESGRRAIALMHELGFDRVRINGEIFERRPGDEKLKVKKIKDDSDDGDGDETE